MIHPKTELRFIDPQIGYGIFATEAIPMGTIVYIKDNFEVEISPRQFSKLDSIHQAIAEKYSYIDQRGVRIISWDNAKYVNHRCECNTMSTGYGFEIAIRDIAAGEEITDEYGMFNIPYEFEVACGCTQCRKVLKPDDLDTYAEQWDASVICALQNITEVNQPLWDLLDMTTRTRLMEYIGGSSDYVSVASLKWNRATKTAARRQNRKAV